jgi:hypothetical protein
MPRQRGHRLVVLCAHREVFGRAHQALRLAIGPRVVGRGVPVRDAEGATEPVRAVWRAMAPGYRATAN